jgi:hypothetical protein
MLQPTGPLPAAVYWRRRAIVLAGLLVVLLLLTWLIVAVSTGPDGGADSGAVRPAAQELSAIPQPPATTFSNQSFHLKADGDRPSTPTASGPTAPGAAPPGATAPGATAPGAAAPGTAAPGTAPGAAQPGTAPRAAVPPAAPGSPQPCPDAAIALTAQPERPEYPAGARPVFKLTVTNASQVACTRDLDPGLQELLVFAADGTTRLWSSNDCYPSEGADLRTLQPGEAITATVTWAGRSSRPRCTGQRVPIPPGDYLVIGKLGPLTSPPTPFKLTR